MKQEQTKIAVFIDFDNIEIGVKTTLSQHFDVGAVLDAIKERGEIVTKIAYGDWTRAGDYGRALSHHAVHMVQRNLTPGGDKNGADINLALDALEMAFTHSHINAFVIVGGDSDFISLVEKLKQYDRKVFVVGGRAFTSQVMQKNCNEFIAYENLVTRGRPAERGRGDGHLAQAMPLVRRALKLLADREVVPQLGLLKSTLLQLDSAFSEREYGAGSFRDFVQRLAKAGFVTLKGSDRSFHVELREGGEPAAPHAPEPPPTRPTAESEAEEEASPEPDGSKPGPADAYRIVREAFLATATTPRWPLYLRQVKQLVRTADPQFDERKYGFTGMVELLRHCQREGFFRLDRDRMGVVRVFPGAGYQRHAPAEDATPADVVSEGADVAALAREAPLPEVPVAASSAAGGSRTEPNLQARGEQPSTSATSGPAEAAPATPRRRGRRQASPGATKAPKKPAGAPAPRKRTASRGKTPKAVE